MSHCRSSTLLPPNLTTPDGNRRSARSMATAVADRGARRSWRSCWLPHLLIKKVRALLFSYNCTSDARRRSLPRLRRSVRFLIPPRCFEGPACRAMDVAVLHCGGYTTPWPWPCSTTAATGDDRRRTSSPLPTPSAAQMAPIKLPSKWTYGDITSMTYDKPQIFLTITFNPNRQEIQDMLFPGQTSQDQPDLVARVFRSKVETIKRMLTKKDIKGVLKANVYVVEFQERGLPHAHLMLM